MESWARLSSVTLTMLVLWVLASPAEAYSSGAPDTACTSMVPSHGASAQTGSSPFSLLVSGTSYSPGTTLNVTLVTTAGEPFKGFLIKAVRRTSGSDQNEAVGSFADEPETRAECTSPVGAALTHTTGNLKSNLSLTWTAPSTPQGNVIFMATFVKEFSTYWVKVESPGEITGPPIPNDTTTLNPVPTSAGPVMDTMFPKDSECGVTKGCFHDCVKPGCSFMLTWRAPSNDEVELGLKAVVRSNRDWWIAVGFSADDQMGDDSVIQCVAVGGVVKAGLSWNVDETNQAVNDASNPVQLVSFKYADDILECVVRRNASVAGSNSKILDLQKDWRLFFGQGKASSGFKMSRHSKWPVVSEAKADLQSTDVDLGISSLSFQLIKVHGSLMSLAWLMLVSLGILMPRYFKPMWPDSDWKGLKIWFQIHRACMISALVATALAVVVIVVEARGYSQILGESYLKAHPILGIIVAILVVANPVMAMFRPPPGTPERQTFNWAHRGVGCTAYLLAVVTIFLGSKIPKANMPGSALYVLIAYVAWQIFVFAVLESVGCASAPKQEDGAPDIPPEEGNPPDAPLKQGMLGLHIGITFAFTIAIIVLIVTAKS